MNEVRRPLVVGIGRSPRSESSSDRALRFCLRTAEQTGSDTQPYSGPALALPNVCPPVAEMTPECLRNLDAVRRADGFIVAAPGYHGSMPGFVKNALDYIEDLLDDPTRYLDGRAVGCVSAASGW